MENQQNMEQQLYQFKYIREQRDMVAQQLEIINASLNNLLNTKTTVSGLKDVKDGDEILLPIGGLLNLKANIKDPDKLLLYVNQDVVIEKDNDATMEFLDKLVEQHREQINYLSNQLQNLEMNLQGMSQMLQQQQRGTPQQ